MTTDLWNDLLYEVSQIPKIKAIIDSEDSELLLGSGNKEADVMFIGDEQSLYEGDDLRVSAGSSGEFLVKLCDMGEISAEKYYITTLTKSNLKYKELFEEEQNKLKELLHMQVALVSPKIIIALGEYSAQCLLDRNINFNKEKNIFFNWKGDIKCLITYDIKYIKDSRENTGKKSKIALEFWKNLQDLKTELNSIENEVTTNE